MSVTPNILSRKMEVAIFKIHCRPWLYSDINYSCTKHYAQYVGLCEKLKKDRLNGKIKYSDKVSFYNKGLLPKRASKKF